MIGAKVNIIIVLTRVELELYLAELNSNTVLNKNPIATIAGTKRMAINIFINLTEH